VTNSTASRLLPIALVFLLVPPAAGQGSQAGPPPHAQPSAAPPGDATTFSVDPIRCWWKTNEGAIRIGETFSLVLTCAVLQNDAVQVVPDETRLASAVMQLTPFEIVRGSHPADLYSGDRRFFQYEYVIRIISPDVIGKDVPIPDLLLHYRVNSRVAENAALQGRDLTYVLPPLAVRVLAMVPSDASDIRDISNESFGIAESLGFRASVLEIAAITAVVLGALLILLSLVRLIVRTRKKKPAGERGIGEPQILRQVARELAAVQRESEAQGWTDPLVDRALAASRIAAAAAVGRPIGQSQKSGQSGEGRLLLPGGRRRKSTTLSGGVTTASVARALDELPEGAAADRRQLLENLQSSLATFTTAQYARTATFDRTALDEAIGRAAAAAERLRAEQTWPRPQLRRWTSWPSAETSH
jgi:hypothetical protein